MSVPRDAVPDEPALHPQRASIEVMKISRISWGWSVEANDETGFGSYGCAWSRDRAVRKAQRFIARRKADRSRRDATREVIH